MNPTKRRLTHRIKDVISNKGILKVSKDIVYEALTGSEKRYPFKDKVELAKAFCLKEMPNKVEGDNLINFFQIVLNEKTREEIKNRLTESNLLIQEPILQENEQPLELEKVIQTEAEETATEQDV